MRLLFISTPAFADCNFPLIKSFQEKGIDVTYLLLMAPFSLRSTLINIKKIYPHTGIYPISIYPELNIYEDYMDMSKFLISNRTGGKVYNFSFWKETYFLRKFIKEGKFDIVHCDTYLRGFRRGFYKLVNNFVTTFHDPFPHEGAERWDNTKTREIAINGSKGLVLLNMKQKELFARKYNVEPCRILINRLGVYDNICQFVKHDKPTLKNNILFFGRITPYKGIEYLCEAMKLVRLQVQDATLTIAGGGRFYFDVEPYKKLGYIEVRNHYINMDELAEVLSRCTLSVCPYTNATQSGVIMTSFSLGKPVIATNVGGLKEMVEDGKGGLIVPPKDVQALANAIISLLNDEKRIKIMSQYILNEYYQGQKSWSNIADKYIDYYNKILNE